MLRPSASASLVLLLGCSAGGVALDVTVVPEDGGVRVTLGSEGKNRFTALGISCEAPAGGRCALLLPAASLQSGWNRVLVESDRRVDARIEARFHAGEAMFPADCSVVPEVVSPDPAEASFALRCRFPPGFHGEIAGRRLDDGHTTVSALECLPDTEGLEVSLARPLLRGAIPLDVVNSAGGRMRRSLPVAVPAPVVQLSMQGWATPWFEQSIPLVIDAEPGATVLIDGTPVPEPAGAGPRRVDHPIARGPNTVRVEARLPGHAPTVHGLQIEGRFPDTPLSIDQSYVSPLVTDRSRLPLSGQTSPDARLYFNGRPLEHVGGRFVVDAFLEQGKNEVELLAVIDPSARVSAKPSTKLQFIVHRDVSPDERLAATLRTLEAGREPIPLAEVARDPWKHLGAGLRFPMTVDVITQNPSLDGSCTARVEGRACTHRVGGQVLLGWSVVAGWTCVGDFVPVLVEGAGCSEAKAGDDVEVVGIVQGALGGRTDGMTAERPRIDGLQVRRLPTVELLEEERWPAVLPVVLTSWRERR